MKLSLSWIFDHINADYRTVDVQQVVAEFNKKVAEIEHYYSYEPAFDRLTIGQVKAIAGDCVTIYSQELNQEISLPKRTDLVIDALYMIKRHETGYSWATTTDFGSSKESIIPRVRDTEIHRSGEWKQYGATTDWIIEVDNKSINHRPDLWSHRGIAREIAAILNLPLRDERSLLATVPVKEYARSASLAETRSLGIANDAKFCRALSGTLLTDIVIEGSDLSVAARLMRVDAKPINAIVDLTNYVMFDIGQPMHAFDAAQIAQSTIIARNATTQEKLMLLDGEIVNLTTDDIVIADADKPLALAGIMGGKTSGVSEGTTRVLLESANFDPAVIRRTAARVKKRTDASTRFEKDLDPHQPPFAIERFIYLLDALKIDYKIQGSIIALGSLDTMAAISVPHARIEQKIGVSITPSFVIESLKKLGFGVEEQNGIYIIQVPTNRATKDIHIPEDIIEEIVRLHGYDAISPTAPTRTMRPFSTDAVMRKRTLKQSMAYGMRSREVYNYALYDEHFLSMMQWQPSRDIQVVSPVSANWTTLVSSLVPGLLKNVYDNAQDYDALRFFELARIWHMHDSKIVEQQSLVAIFWSKQEIGFYDVKSYLIDLFAKHKMTVSYIQISDPKSPWYMPYQAATISYQEKEIGHVGVVPATLLHRLVQGYACVFELDASIFTVHQEKDYTFVMPSKYPTVHRDISMLVDRALHVDEIEKIIRSVDARIADVMLVDMFEKKEWNDKRSLTFRFGITDHEKTISREESEIIGLRIAEFLTARGATIR